VEIGDFARFEHPNPVMSYFGLVPSEYSSGETRRHGAIT
jgi:transposase